MSELGATGESWDDLIDTFFAPAERGDPGETARVSFQERDDRHVFKVTNPGRIPEKIALQIFKRSFNTKSALE